MEQGRFHGGLAFLSVAQETVVRWETPKADGGMNNRLFNCRRYQPRKQIAGMGGGLWLESDQRRADRRKSYGVHAAGRLYDLGIRGSLRSAVRTAIECLPSKVYAGG